MADLIYLTSIVVATYLSSVAFMGLMFKVFFPLKTKEEWAKIKALESAGTVEPVRTQRIPKIRRATHGMLNESRQLA